MIFLLGDTMPHTRNLKIFETMETFKENWKETSSWIVVFSGINQKMPELNSGTKYLNVRQGILVRNIFMILARISLVSSALNAYQD